MSYTARIESVKRLQNSTNGNPRYAVKFPDGSALRTKPDAGFVFGVRWERLDGASATITTNGRGQIIDLEPVAP